MPEINVIYEKLLKRISNGSVNQINKAFASMINDLTIRISGQWITDPRINKRLRSYIVKIRREFTKSFNKILTDYEIKAINLSERKNLIEIERAIRGLEIESGIIRTWVGRPLTPNVRSLSGRVWNITKGFYKNLDFVLKTGLMTGTSADVVKKQLTTLLNKPNALSINELRRRGIEAAGGERQYRKLEKEIQNYAPGRGIYKSAKKNAYRLARTEINRAYRQQDHNIRSRLPWITGIEVKLSGSHPRFDICDDMVGKYPKDYNFLGFHPACICYTVPIMATDKQIRAIINKEKVKLKPIKRIPQRAENYIKKNAKIINKRKTTPFFIDENPSYFHHLL